MGLNMEVVVDRGAVSSFNSCKVGTRVLATKQAWDGMAR